MKTWERYREMLGLAETRLEQVARMSQEILDFDMDPDTVRRRVLEMYEVTKRYLPEDERKGYNEIERVPVDMPEEVRMQMLHGRRPVEETDDESGAQGS